MTDELLKLNFAAAVRGEAVHLSDTWRRIVEHHAYPAPVERLLGELTAATALLASNLKFDGTLILQIHGDGPVKLAVVECQSDLRLRATAKLRDGATVDDGASLQSLVNRHGQGRCALTLDARNRQPGQQPYQGIVPLEGDSVAQVIESYMRNSEQLQTRLWLSCDGARAAGLLLQKLPTEGGRLKGDDDAWPRLGALADTVSPAELVQLSPAELARRLFWQESPQVAARLSPRFECTCSRERIGRMLLSLGREEVDGIVAELGAVTVTCDFCHAQHAFDAVDIGELFATGTNPGANVNPTQ